VVFLYSPLLSLIPCFFAKYSGEYKSISLDFLILLSLAFCGFFNFARVFCGLASISSALVTDLGFLINTYLNAVA